MMMTMVVLCLVAMVVSAAVVRVCIHRHEAFGLAEFLTAVLASGGIVAAAAMMAGTVLAWINGKTGAALLVSGFGLALIAILVLLVANGAVQWEILNRYCVEMMNECGRQAQACDDAFRTGSRSKSEYAALDAKRRRMNGMRDYFYDLTFTSRPLAVLRREVCIDRTYAKVSGQGCFGNWD